jgi:hypothetical protein
MAKNKIADLNDHLFAQLERLNDETITKSEDMEMEIKKANAISQISGQILKSAALTLQASKLSYAGDVKDLPEQFGVKSLNEG